MVAMRTIEDFDKLEAALEEIKVRLVRAEDLRLHLVNERVKLTKEVVGLRERVETLANERTQILRDNAELKLKLDRAEARLKTLGLQRNKGT
jgi:predicted nuclease with TOPRIM domain